MSGEADRVIRVNTGQIPAQVLRAGVGSRQYQAYAERGKMVCRQCGKAVYGWQALAEHVLNAPKRHKDSVRWAKDYLKGGSDHYHHIRRRISDIGRRIDALSG